MTELHVHLDGSLRPSSVFDMTLEQKLSLPADTPEELMEHLTVPPDCRDLTQYLERFALPLKVLQKPEALTRAVRELILDLMEDGVTAAEIRFAPQFHTGGGYSQREMTQAAIAGLRDDFYGSLILCCMRGADNQAANEETLKTAAALLGSGVCAVDLAGAEELFPTKDYAELFSRARRMDLPFTIHAGEAAGPESIWDALRMGASRIGHGVRAVEDPALCRYLADRRIPLEVCYTSNLHTRAFPEGTPHSMRTLFDMGLCVTFNTDNRTVSGTTMHREMEQLKQDLGFTREEFAMMQFYAGEALFSQ
ncbi:MAG: adenosine deaminase [Lachnospiraceae bacterium]|nr:adenosine deaminase [Lachnospiraceae bacterium]